MKKVFIKKYFYFSIISILLFTTGYMTLYYKVGSSAVLSKAFESSGAKFVSSEVYAWGKIEGNPSDTINLEQLVDRLAVEMGILENDAFSRKVIKNDSIEKVEVIGSVDTGKTVNVIGQLNKNMGTQLDGYVSIGVSCDYSDSEIEEVMKSIRVVFSKNKLKPKINTCMTGFYDGRLEYEALNRISKQILKHASAKKIHGISDNNLISVSAYSPFINNNLRVGGREVNMNLAIRYNSFEDKTYIWLASPVITIEY